MSQIYNDNSKRPKPKENQPGILRISFREFMHSVKNSSKGLGSRRGPCWGYISIFENTPRKLLHLSCENFFYLVVQGKAQLEHSSHMLMLVLRLHAASSPDLY